VAVADGLGWYHSTPGSAVLVLPLPGSRIVENQQDYAVYDAICGVAYISTAGDASSRT
jgi:hypothetical protein